MKCNKAQHTCMQKSTCLILLCFMCKFFTSHGRFNVFPREAQLQACLTGLVEALLAQPTTDDPQDKIIGQKKSKNHSFSVVSRSTPLFIVFTHVIEYSARVAALSVSWSTHNQCTHAQLQKLKITLTHCLKNPLRLHHMT